MISYPGKYLHNYFYTISGTLTCNSYPEPECGIIVELLREGASRVFHRHFLADSGLLRPQTNCVEKA